MAADEQAEITTTPTGRSILSTRAIDSVVRLAAESASGVVRLASSPEVTSPVDAPDGQAGPMAVSLALVAAYGEPLPDLATRVQTAVVEAVGGMTALLVVSVDVSVVDVEAPEPRHVTTLAR